MPVPAQTPAFSTWPGSTWVKLGHDAKVAGP
jgi:hypothetical protein